MIGAIDPKTEEQIRRNLDNPAFCEDTVYMPDLHFGKGSTVGTTMKLSKWVIPNMIGVDIYCGMLMLIFFAWHSGKKDDPRNPWIDSTIRRLVPFGQNVHEVAKFDMRDFDWAGLNEKASRFTEAFNAKFGTSYAAPVYSYEWFLDLCRRVGIDPVYVACSLLSAGSGNHFIEVGVLSDGRITITIHCGSRNLGVKVANYWQNIAATTKPEISRSEWVDKVKAEYPREEWGTLIKEYNARFMKQSLQPAGTEYLEGDDIFGYLTDMWFTQEYAKLNRQLIGDAIMEALGIQDDLCEVISTPHNYIDMEDMTIRKGAIRAYAGEKMVIPMNMSEGILVCEGKSNPDWNFSAPHGAGRIGSREEMFKKFKAGEVTRDQILDSMKDVYTSGIPVDESRFAYKPTETIMECIEPTAHILDIAVPVIGIKHVKPEEDAMCLVSGR